MKARELRIGNLTKQGEIKNFWEKGVHVGFGKCYEFNELEPIQITEEWLLSIGANKNRNQIYFGNGTILLSWWGIDTIDLEIEGHILEIKCRYVHQLQNLYFVLTQTELTIK